MLQADQRIQFKFAAPKAYAAIRWMVARSPGVDLHTVLKACYFADKEHLNMHERPIFGATYKAMPFGPVPLEIYEMAKAEPLSMADLGIDTVPWTLRGFSLYPVANSEPDMGALSQTDRDALERGFTLSSSMTFTQRTAATHGPDWQAARLGIMNYEDMIEEGPSKADLVEFLRNEARYLRL